MSTQRIPYEDTEHYEEHLWTDGLGTTLALLAFIAALLLMIVGAG